ncbi:unnamed protein product [Owenia fusiformis]|uniref:Uncharacterized protein n=1 Tax=Owenia fusiformis TaxID=6347 RepID=A0A8J1UCQ6_OWEFU|nr:unnamed protein product [Owenia fusiformis]
MDRLRRFICLGSESGTYYISETDLGIENAACIQRLIDDGRGVEAVKELITYSTEGRVAKDKPIIFALAFLARNSKDLKTKTAAYNALSDICRIPTQLFIFIDFAQNLSGNTKGWGRCQRTAISDWYNDKIPKQLALHVTKYIQRNGWSHKDVLRLGHVKPENQGTSVILRYVVKGLEATKKEYLKEDSPSNIQELISYLEVVDTVKHSGDKQQVARLIEEYDLAREHVPTSMLNCREIWRALLQHMPMTAMLRNLSKMTTMGLFPSRGDNTKLVVDRLKDEELLRKARIHPFNVLIALKAYEQGKSDRGKLRWIPNEQIRAALNSAFYASFKFIEPTNKRFLIAVDISSSMTHGGIHGTPQMSPAIGAAAMAMSTARTEPHYQIVAFSTDIRPVELNGSLTVQQCCLKFAELSEGGTNCSKPMQWAMEKNLAYDVFIVYTDCETWYGNTHPSEALRQYRAAMNIPNARLIVCCMTSNGFTLADPEDPGMLDIAGFDSAAPEVIRNFVMGHL